MTLEALKKFCNPDHERALYHAPWSVGDFTFFSDGAVVVRVPRMAEVAEDLKAPDPNRLIKTIFPTGKSGWKALPEVPADSDQVKINAGVFHAWYIQRLAELPGVVCRSMGDFPESPLGVRFDGGIAMLMPLRPDLKGKESR